jgi:hypothetical protein
MSFGNFPNPKRTKIVPQNYTKGKSVREYVEHYAHSHKMRTEQALAVQGSDAIIWNRIYSNRFCTCQDLDSVINNNPSVTQNLRPEVLQAQQDAEFKNLAKQPAKNTVTQILKDNGLSSLLDVVNSQYEEDVETNISQDPEIKVQGKQNSLIEEALQLQQKNLGVEFAESSACPICFSTRRVDSYQPYRGVRLVLDASNFYQTTTEGVRLNNEVFPHSFDFEDDVGNVVWEIELPCYFRTESIRLFNLDKLTTSFTLEFKENTALSFIPLSNITLDARNGLRNVLQIKASLNVNNLSENLRTLKIAFTHLEIILMFVDEYEKIELPALEIPDNIDYQELYLRSRAIFSPGIENIGRNSLFCEKRYGHLWEITGLVKNFTSAGNLVSLKGDTRLIQNSERLHLLNLFPHTLNSTASGYSR